MEKSKYAYGQMTVALRWLVLLATLAMVATAMSGARHMHFTNDYRYFFSEENPNRAAWDEVQRTYTQSNVIMWVLHNPKEKMTSPEMLALVGEITERAWQTPSSVRVDSITNFQHTRAEEDDLFVGDLVPDPANVSPQEALQIEAIALAEPMIAKRILAEDGHATAVVVTLQLEDGDQTQNKAAMVFARDIKADIIARYPDVGVGVTGVSALSDAFASSSQKDLKTLIPLMFVVIGAMVYLLTRSASGTLATLLVVGFSAGCAMAIAGWMGIPISPPSAVAPNVILTVAVADSIHILITMLVEMRHGRTKRDAIVESLRVNMAPVFLTSVTTAIGFLSLNFSDAPPMKDFGNIAAMGAMIAWFLSITMLPALLAVLPIKPSKVVEAQSAWMASLARPIIAMRHVILVLFVVLIGASAMKVQTLEFNDRFTTYFDPVTEFRQDTDFAAEHLSGIYQAHYSIGAKDSGGISDPEYLRVLDDLAEWLREQPEIHHVASFTDIMKRLNKSMHGDDPAFYTVPQERSLAAQYLLLFEMSLPYGLDLNDQINVDKSATRLVVTLHTISTNEIDILRARTQAWMDANAPKYMHANPAGQVIMFGYIGRTNFEAMKLGSAVAVIVISLILLIALRSVKLGILSFITNVSPPLLAFGLYAVFRDELGFWSTPVFVAALGLIVDVTVHFLMKYRRAHVERGESVDDSIHYAFQTVGTALLVSSVVLMAGFGVLAMSNFIINAMMGLMVMTIIAVALITDFLLLPALLKTIDR